MLKTTLTNHSGVSTPAAPHCHPNLRLRRDLPCRWDRVASASRRHSRSAGATDGNMTLHYTLHSDRQSSHQQIAQLVRRLGRAPVLDVGAAQGFRGKMLQQDRLQIDAVEPHPIWAEHARAYYHTVYASSIEEAGLPAGRYPVIVCADVLEHTVDPVSVLKQLHETATEDATFIISLPNVAHIA